MKQITDHIGKRRSVRTFDGQELREEDRAKLHSFIETIENPFGIPVEFKFLHAKEQGLVCPVVSGTDLYVGGKVNRVPNANVAFGYAFERFILYAQSLGIGTVWLGGTMNRSAYEQAMELQEEEIMPCASPLGYPAKKMSMREVTMRKAIKADERMPFAELFFDGDFHTPLTKDRAGVFLQPLEMVRLAPSAVNKQPWRAVVADNAVHFYLKRSKGFGYDADHDMQKIDLGIALCHFALTAKEQGLCLSFSQANSFPVSEDDVEYIASYELM